MKKTLLIILLMSFVFCQNVSLNITQMSDTEKLLYYQSVKKDPATAVMYSLLFPTGGHLYADNFERGLLFKGAEILSLSLGLYIINESEQLDPNIFIFTAPLILVWELFDAAKTTTKYNEELYNRIFFSKENTDITEELRKYSKLRDDGIITEEEFQTKKKELLGL